MAWRLKERRPGFAPPLTHPSARAWELHGPAIFCFALVSMMGANRNARRRARARVCARPVGGGVRAVFLWTHLSLYRGCPVPSCDAMRALAARASPSFPSYISSPSGVRPGPGAPSAGHLWNRLRSRASVRSGDPKPVLNTCLRVSPTPSRLLPEESSDR